MATRIRYGLRRYPLMVVIFVAAAIGFSVWASQIDKPTFVFPLGRLAPEDARVAVFGVAALAAGYVVAMTYVRFVRRPVVVLEKGRATIPLGEFGLRTVTLQKGDVMEIID